MKHIKPEMISHQHYGLSSIKIDTEKFHAVSGKDEFSHLVRSGHNIKSKSPNPVNDKAVLSGQCKYSAKG